METEEINIAALRRDARRYHQLLPHPTDSRHLLTLLQTGQGSKEHLGRILDQLHIQDLAKSGTRAAARIWQEGGADGKTGTARAAEAVVSTRKEIADINASMAVIDAGRLRRAERDGYHYAGPERRSSDRAFGPVKADLSDLETRIAAAHPGFAMPYGATGDA